MMPVIRGFDTEKKRTRETRRIQVGDASRNQRVGQAEQRVDGEEKCGKSQEQLCPADRHEVVVQVLENNSCQSMGNDYAITKIQAPGRMDLVR
jgi:hypothetical protein